METMEELVHSVDELYEAGNFYEAIEACNQILEQEPDNVGVLITLGNLYTNNEEYNKAKAVFSKIDTLEIPVELQEKKNNNHALLMINLVINSWTTVEGQEGKLPASEKDIELSRIYLQQARDLNPTWETLIDKIEDCEENIKFAEDFLANYDNESQEELDENEQKAVDYLQEAFALWTDITQEGDDNEYRTPTSKKQLTQSEELINKAKALNPQNQETLDWIAELEDVLESAKKRKFDGSYKLIGASVILLLFMYYGPMSGMGFFGFLGKTVFFWGSALLYIAASFAPQFLIDKRSQWISSLGTGVMASVFASLFSTSSNETRWAHSDGSSSTEYHNTGSVIGLVLLFVVTMALGAFIGVIAIISGLRNYVFYI